MQSRAGRDTHCPKLDAMCVDLVRGAPANMPRRYTQGAEISAVGKLLPRITLSLCKPSPPLILE